MLQYIIPAIIIIIILVILVKNIRVVQQARAYVIERLGAYSTTWNVGLHFKVPFIDNIRKYSKAAMLYDIPPSEVLTSDKKNMTVDSYVLWKIDDPLKKEMIDRRHKANLFKLQLMPAFEPEIRYE